MRIRLCPTCNNSKLRTLDAPSEIAAVNYYRCETCGAVWNVDKADPNGPIHIVAVGVPPKDVQLQ